MHNERPLPPIASPYGGGDLGEQLIDLIDDIEPVISVRLSFKTALRWGCIDLFYPTNQTLLFVASAFCRDVVLRIRPFTQLFSPLELLIGCLAACVFLMAIIATGWRLRFARRFEVEVERTAIHICPLGRALNYFDDKTVLPWNQIISIIHCDGNVYIAAGFSDYLTPRSCLIPRESFDSPAQARAFASSLRQIWHNELAKSV